MSNSQQSSSFIVEPARRSESLASYVANQLEAMITQEHIKTGEKLPTEAKLCDMFEVSRTVVREAITQLKSLGLVETRRGVGTTVIRTKPAETLYAYDINPTAIEDILNILELRMCVEEKAAEMAALRRSDEDIAKLEACLVAFDEAIAKGDVAREEDLAFHLAIANAAGNPFFRQFYESFNKNIIPRANIVKASLDVHATDAYLERIRVEHRAILDAIKAGESESARQAMHAHLYRAYHLYEQYRADQE